MTRFLSHALQAPEPSFSHGLRRLETAHGHPSHDVRLSSEIIQSSKSKLIELGLDPNDTTPKELYEALQERVKIDDANLTKKLRTKAGRHVSAEADVIDGMIHVIKELPDTKSCYALKPSRLKSLLKTVPPKRAMKKLGYRSIDSFLKHETPVSVLTAAWLTEGSGWQGRLLDQYKRLQPSDFEVRNISLTQMNSKRWQQLAADLVEQKQHNLISFKELGALVFLPLSGKEPAGTVTVSLSLALHEINEIRAASTFLKLSQVRADFGQIVNSIAQDEPRLNSYLLDQPVPWHLIHRYYARLKDRFREDIFEPYLQLEDMAWHPVETTLCMIEPSLSFWHKTAHLGQLDGHKPVSFNLIDSALNVCNNLPFEKRAVHFFQRSLWHELLLGYLHHQPIEDSVLAELQPKFATEKALA